MAYKRYFNINGKKYGPYYYESYRDSSGKVKKRYVKVIEEDKKSFTPTDFFSIINNKKLYLILGILFLALIFGFFLMNNNSNEVTKSNAANSKLLGGFTGYVVSEISEEEILQSYKNDKADLSIKEPKKIFGNIVSENKNKRMDFSLSSGEIRVYFDLLNYSNFVSNIEEKIINGESSQVGSSQINNPGLTGNVVSEEENTSVDNGNLEENIIEENNSSNKINENDNEQNLVDENSINGNENNEIKNEISIDEVKQKVEEIESEEIEVIADSSKVEAENFDINIDKIPDENEKESSYKWGYKVRLNDYKFLAKIDVTSGDKISVYNENSLKIGRNILSFSDLESQGYKVSFEKPNLDIVEEKVEEVVQVIEKEDTTIENIENVTEENVNESQESQGNESSVEENTVNSETSVDESTGNVDNNVDETVGDGAANNGEDTSNEKSETPVEEGANNAEASSEASSESISETTSDPASESVSESLSESVSETSSESTSEGSVEASPGITGGVIRFFSGITAKIIGIDEESVVEDISYENIITVYIERDFTNNNEGIELGDIIEIDPTLIIYISKAEHLDSSRNYISDIYESVSVLDGNFSEEISVGDFVRVSFEENLTNERDITIYARGTSGESSIEVYEKDGNDVIAKFEGISEEKEYKIYLENLSLYQDTFDLKILDNPASFDYIVDPFIDNGSMIQYVYDCGILNTTGATYILNQSINTTGTCFNITADNVTLDGNGYSIDGDDSGTDYGIYANGRINLTIKNFNNITDFASAGIYFNNINNSLIYNSSILSNNEGIHFLSSYNNNLSIITSNNNSQSGIYFNTANYNTLFNITSNSNSNGIYFNPGSNNNLSIITSNYNSQNGMYLISYSNNNKLISVTSNSNLNSGIYFQSSSNNTLFDFTSNSNLGYGINIYTSSMNVINNFSLWNCSKSASFACISLFGVFDYANDNSLINGNINYTTNSGIAIQTMPMNGYVRNNYFKNIKIENINGNIIYVGLLVGGDSINNTFINVSYQSSGEAFSGCISTTCEIIRKWYYSASVNDTRGLAVDGANVSLVNVSGVNQGTLLTNALGLTNLTEIIEYVNYAGTRTYYSNYTLNASKNGYGASGHVMNFSISQNLLNDYFILDSTLNITQTYSQNISSTVGGSVVRGDNVTINATIVNATIIDKVWIKLWQGAVGVSQVIWQGFMAFISGNLWSVTIPTNMTWNIGEVNYTVYANDTIGQEVNMSSNVTMLQGFNLTQCGVLDVENGYYRLMNNVSNNETCFNITADNVTLDGNGYLINFSSDSGDANYGIYGNRISNITIKNCKFIAKSRDSYYDDGIYLANSNFSLIYNNSFESCFNGVNIVNSTFITIENNTLNNIATGVYFWAVTDSNVTNNIINDGNSWSGVALSISNRSLIYGNLISNFTGMVVITGAIDLSSSYYNRIILNNITGVYSGIQLILSNYNNLSMNNIKNINLNGDGSGLRLVGNYNYVEKIFIQNVSYGDDGLTVEGSYNIVNETRIDFSRTNALYFNEAQNNSLYNINITNSGYFIESIGNKNLNNNLINVTTTNDSERLSLGTDYFRKWYLDVNVSNLTSQLDNALINSSNRTGSLQYSDLTSSSGIVRQELVEYVNINGTRTYYSPYTLNVTKTGYSDYGNNSVNISSNKWMDVRLDVSSDGSIGITQCQELNQANTTYVLQNNANTTGTCFNITADNVTLNLNGFDIIGSQNGYGVYGTGINNINISRGGYIKNFSNAIYLMDVNYSVIEGLNINENNGVYSGIYLLQSNYNNLTAINYSYNNASNNSGLFVESSSYNNIWNNYFNFNNVTHATGNLYGAPILGLYLNSLGNNIENSTLINNLFIMGGSSSILGGGLFGLSSGCNNSIIRNTNISNNFMNLSNFIIGGAIGLYDSSNNNISSSIIFNNTFKSTQAFRGGAIGIQESYNNIILLSSINNNYIESNTVSGGVIGIAYGSNYNNISSSFISGNIVRVNSMIDGGIIGVEASTNFIWNSTITRNNITLYDVYGGGVIGLESNNDAFLTNISNNNITMFQIHGGGVIGTYWGEYVNFSINTIVGNIITITDSIYGGGIIGISSYDSSYNTIFNNIILNNTISNSNYVIGGGVIGMNSAHYNNISLSLVSGNLIRLNHEVYGGGIIGINYGRGNNISLSTISNNNITNNNVSGGGIIGFIGSTSTNNSILSSSISGNNLSNYYLGGGAIIGLFDSSYNKFINISINGSSNLGKGIGLQRSSSYNLFKDIEISYSGDYAIGVNNHLNANSINNTFNNLSAIYAPNGSLYISQQYNGTNLIDISNLGNYTIFGTGATINIENTLYGKISYINVVSGSGTNFSNDIRIGNNSITVESGSQNGLNRSANLRLYGLSTSYLNPKIYRNGNIICNSTTNPSCYNFSSLNAGIVIFNVSSWSNYSIGELNETLNLTLNITQTIYQNQSGTVGGSVVRGDNVTINATIVNATVIDRVWIKIWQGAIGASQIIWQGFMAFISGNLWSVTIPTNSSWNVGLMNYTVYANDTIGQEVNLSSNVTMLQGFNLTECGVLDQVNGYYRLMNEIEINDSPTSDCFIISANNITLDLNGFGIISNWTGVEDDPCFLKTKSFIRLSNSNNSRIFNGYANNFSGYGIYDSGAYVYGTIIENFSVNYGCHAIFMLNSDNIYVNNITSIENLGGIYANDNNIIKNVYYYNNHIGGMITTRGIWLKDNNTLENNIVVNNVSYGINVEDNNTLINNFIINNSNELYTTEQGSLGLQNNNYVENLFIDNVICGITLGSNNTIKFFNITNSDFGIYPKELITYYTNNTFIDGSISNSNILDINLTRSSQTVKFYFINISYNYSREFVKGANVSLIRKWYLDVNVSNITGQLDNSLVNSSNSSGILQVSTLTGSSGIVRQELTEYININGTWIYYSPYTLNVTKSNYTSYGNNSVNISGNKWMDVRLDVSGDGTISVTECQELNISGGYYRFVSDIYANGTCFNITDDNITLDGNGYDLHGIFDAQLGDEFGIYALNIKNLNIKNIKNISNYGSDGSLDGAIYLAGINNSIITNISLESNNYAFRIDTNSRNNYIYNLSSYNSYYGVYSVGYNNTFSDIITNNNSNGFTLSGYNSSLNILTTKYNRWSGLDLSSSSGYNLVMNVTSLYNQYGLFSYYSQFNILKYNNFSGNDINFRIFEDYNNTIDPSNIVDYNYRIYYNYSISNYIYDENTAPNAGLVYCINCINVTIRNLNLSHYNYDGVYFYNTTESFIQNLSTDYNSYGINLERSSRNFISNINSENNINSLYLYGLSTSNRFYNLSSKDSHSGILLYDDPTNNSFDGILISNVNLSIDIFGCSNNTFSNFSLFNCSNSSINSCINLYSSVSTNVESNWFISGLIDTSYESSKGIWIQSTASGYNKNNYFKDIKLKNISGDYIRIERTSGTASNNTFVNVSYPLSSEIVSGTSAELIRKGYYSASVNDTRGLAVSGANVSLVNVSGVNQGTLLTNDLGLTNLTEVIEYVNYAGTRTYYSNYTLNASKNGYGASGKTKNFSISQNLLNDYFILDSTLNVTSVISQNQSGSAGGTVARGDNVTINATIVNATIIDKVWIKLWQGAIGASQIIWQGFMAFISGNLWSVTIPTNWTFPVGEVNYYCL
ncbi:MAG: hypothetical protein WC867_00820 [Candidatus Pacearchaeota archaeon]|jgi:hypothetical protein